MKNFLFKVLMYLILFSVVGIFVNRANATIRYQLVVLGTLGGPSSYAYDINNESQIVEGSGSF